jgi:hypothetical protein
MIFQYTTMFSSEIGFMHCKKKYIGLLLLTGLHLI